MRCDVFTVFGSSPLPEAALAMFFAPSMGPPPPPSPFPPGSASFSCFTPLMSVPNCATPLFPRSSPDVYLSAASLIFSNAIGHPFFVEPEVDFRADPRELAARPAVDLREGADVLEAGAREADALPREPPRDRAPLEADRVD